MPQPLFFWEVLLRNGEVKREIDGLTFSRDIVPIAMEVRKLILRDELGEFRYGVDLDTGDFFINGSSLSAMGVQWAQHPDVEYPITGGGDWKAAELRPIYHRRRTNFIRMLLPSDTAEYIPGFHIYAIGWQATVDIPISDHSMQCYHLEKRNIKHILYIHQDGKVTLS
jgi:hypothetical protein